MQTNSLIHLNILLNFVGPKIYIVFFVAVLASIAEGFGILMALPLIAHLGEESMLGGIDSTSLIFPEFLISAGFDGGILYTIFYITLFFISKSVLLIFSDVYRVKIKTDLQKNLKTSLYDYFLKMQMQYYLSYDAGHFVNVINTQLSKFVLGANQLITVGTAIFSAVVYVGFAVIISWQFGLMALFIGFFYFVTLRRLSHIVTSSSRDHTRLSGVLAGFLVQSIHALRYIIATSEQKALRTKVVESIEGLSKREFRIGVANSLVSQIREPVAVVSIMGIVVVQTEILQQPLAPVLVSIALFYRGLNFVLQIQSRWNTFLSTVGAIEIVNNEFSRQREQQEQPGFVECGDFTSNIVFDSVNYSYPQASGAVLKDVSFVISKNSTTAIVGRSGAGKSTIFNLLCLLFEPTTGQILVDRVNSKDLLKSAWRRNLGYVCQDSVIFNASIADNISMWRPDCSMSEIKEAANKASLDEFIDSLPDGYETQVGDRGVRLSGGQRQRLFIARELFRNPKLLLLDEATSALDSMSEKEVQRSIDALKGSVTVVMIAHRLSTIANADSVIVMDEGRVIEQGNYAQLKYNPGSHLNKLALAQQV